MNLKILKTPFLPHSMQETIKFLAWLRYPKDKVKRQTFIRNPGTVRLNAKELVYLIRTQKLQEALSRLDAVERTAKSLSPEDSTYSIGEKILTKITLADYHYQKGNLTQFYSVLFDIERLCGKANIVILGPHAQRGKRTLEGSKKPRPRKEDPLNNLLVSALKKLPPDLKAEEILDRLENFDDDSILSDVSKEKSLTYINAHDRLHKISFKTFQNRLTKVKKSPQKQNLS